MITLEKAIEIAIAAEGGEVVELAVNAEDIVERSYGWVVFPNSKEFIETGDFRSALIGSGGVLVLKSSGKMYRFISAFNVEKNLEIFESGYLDHENWDIVITRVSDEAEALDQVLALGATYVAPGEESGMYWGGPKTYSRKRMKQLLQNPPIRLNIGPIYINFDEVEGLEKQHHFEYRIEPNQGYVNAP